jgi:WD40 repeat protein
VQALLHEEIARLPEKYRSPFLLCCVEGMGRAEAARQLGVKEGTVWSRLAQARTRLRARLERRGVDLSAVLGGTALASEARQAAPVALQKLTIEAALGSAGVSSPSVAVLVRNVTASMLTTRLKLATTILFFAGVVALGAGLLRRPAGGEEQPKQQARSIQPAELRDRHGDPLPAGAILRIGTLRYRTGGGINQAVITPDGKILAAASEVGISLFDLANGKRILLRETHVPNGFGNTHSVLAFTRGGKELVNVTQGGSLRFWDVATGKLLRQFGKGLEVQGGPGGIRPAPPPIRPGANRWSGVWDAPTSRFLVANQLGKVMLLDPSSGKVERSFSVVGDVSSVSLDGKRLVTIHEKQSEAILYDDSGKEQRRLSHPGGIYRATLTPGGKLLVTFNKESEIRVWDCDTGKEKRRVAKGDRPGHLVPFLTVTAVSRDGKTLLAGTQQGEVLRWDLDTGKPRKPLAVHWNWVTGLFPLADGKTLVSVSWDHLIRRTDLTTGKTASSGNGYAGYAKVARSPTGPLAAVGDSQGRLELWDTATGKLVRRLRAAGPPSTMLRFSGDGKVLAVGQGDGKVVLWEVVSAKERRRWDIGTVNRTDANPMWFQTLSFSPDDRFLATSARFHGTCVWEVATAKAVWRNGETAWAAFSADGRTLATSTWDSKQLCFRDAATGLVRTKVAASPESNEHIEAIVFSLDGRNLATCHLGGTVYLRDPATGEVRKRLRGFKEAAWNASFSPDGKWLAASGDQAVRVWEVATGTELLCLNGHEGRALQALFGSDARTVLSCSFDLTALLWDLRPKPGKQRKPDDLWADLASDPATSYRAQWALVEDPRMSCALLRRKISLVKDNVDKAHLHRLLVQLDSDEFQQREAASRALAEMGEAVEGALREALKETQSVEVRRRLKDVLAKLTGSPTADDLRQTRAVHVLELCGTAEARQVLRVWAGGAKGARLTKDAGTALERLERARR